MLNNWFECKVRYEKMMENGSQKKVTEPYVFDALSFTEAEARIIEEITPYISGSFEVTDIKKANYSEVFFDSADRADRWFKCKVAFITIDENSGAEKESSTNMLVQASDLRGAIDSLANGLKGGLCDYRIKSVSQTKIMNVYPYTAKEEEEGDNE